MYFLIRIVIRLHFGIIDLFKLVDEIEVVFFCSLFLDVCLLEAVFGNIQEITHITRKGIRGT